MAGVNTWLLRCDVPGDGVAPGMYAMVPPASGGPLWQLDGSGQKPQGPAYEIALVDLGGGNVGFQYGAGVDAYASVVWSISVYVAGLDFQDMSGNWITTAGANESYQLQPTGDGLFVIYSPAANAYVRISKGIDEGYPNPITTQWTTRMDPGQAARFTAIGQSRPAAIDFVEVVKDASGMSFVGIDVSGVPFSGCNLSGCDFHGVDLTGANLTGANLAGTDLTGVNLTGTNLSGFDLSTLKLSTPLIQSKDPRAPTILAHCTVPFALIGLNWSCLDLTGATITGLPASLAGLNAAGAVLSGHVFEGCILNGANFAGATLEGTDFTGASLHKAVFDGARMPGAVFTRAKLETASFIGAALGGVAHQRATVFSFAYIGNCDFSQANLFGVSFADASMVGSNKLSGAANLQEADFSNAYMPNVDFTGAVLQGAKFDGAFMVECILTNANLSPAQDGSALSSLTAACLQAATLQGTDFSGADLTNAAITDTAGSIPMQYYDQDGKLTPSFPLPYPAGSFPAASSFNGSTICPNGTPYSTNVSNGLPVAQMMAATTPPTSWAPRDQATAPKGDALAAAGQ